LPTEEKPWLKRKAMKDEEEPNEVVVWPSSLNEKSAKRQQPPIVPKMQNLILQ
jgi:hypothetical protein